MKIFSLIAIVVTSGTLVVTIAISRNDKPEERTPVLVAIKLIPAGTSGEMAFDTGAGLIGYGQPEQPRIDGDIVDPAFLHDRVVIRDIQPGEQILASYFRRAP